MPAFIVKDHPKQITWGQFNCSHPINPERPSVINPFLVSNAVTTRGNRDSSNPAIRLFYLFTQPIPTGEPKPEIPHFPREHLQHDRIDLDARQIHFPASRR